MTDITIPEDLLARAETDAAQRGTSLAALVQVLLQGHLARTELALPGNYEILVRVALGQLSTDAAVTQLHLESEDDLFILLTYCGLPRPRVSPALEEQMRERLATVYARMAP